MIVEINAKLWVDKDKMIDYAKSMINSGFNVRVINVDAFDRIFYGKELVSIGLKEVRN